MSERRPKGPSSLPGGLPMRRKTVRVATAELSESGFVGSQGSLPFAFRATIEGVDLAAWATTNRHAIEAALVEHGALLFRGFAVEAVAAFERFITAVTGGLLEYDYRSTPRHQVSGRIYTSTEYPSDQTIPLHNEMAYASSWPTKIFFCCLRPAETGGQTPVADSRRVFRHIDPVVRARFVDKGVMYVRNCGQGLDLSWQEVFQVEDRNEVERYCRASGISFEWRADGRLRTRQVRKAVARHPSTEELVWFNQAHLFHPSSLAPEVRESLLSIFAPEDLPRNAYYGDGSAIEPSALDEIRRAFAAEQSIFDWQKGDVLMLDNMLAAHGRMPFTGDRKVVVGLAEPLVGE